ncbi:diguanylate cyclase [Bacillus marasmi]|uniref:diguanylate cyclase n=1 Tax=Bacillus marasmi TaxID=1926279 RepID=UPI0011CA55EC|nr:diguanylate cyclase [Bacillus marasmi]
MIEDLIANGSLIISFLFIAGQIFKNSPLNLSARIITRMLAGIIGGIWGTVLMWFSIEVSDTIILDMRSIALVLTTLYGGPLASFIFVMIFSFFRVALFGLNEASIVAIVILMILSISCSLIIKIDKWSIPKKYWTMIFLNLSLYCSSLIYLIDDASKLGKLFFYFSLISLCTAYFSYVVVIYIQKSNELFRKYMEESKIDFLTGLHNVRAFDEMFNEQIRIVENQKEILSVLIIDIDFFKKVNDTYGHTDGDLVLQKLGTTLKQSSRSFDIVARKGGEEFAVLLLDCTLQRALEIAEKIRHKVEHTKFPISNGQEINITISIGVASYPGTVENHKDLLHQADAALYLAKRSGRNMVCHGN